MIVEVLAVEGEMLVQEGAHVVEAVVVVVSHLVLEVLVLVVEGSHQVVHQQQVRKLIMGADFDEERAFEIFGRFYQFSRIIVLAFLLPLTKVLLVCFLSPSLARRRVRNWSQC